MIPVKLTIRGFLSYQEAAEIDFTGLHVACITGQNGAGKSTMLDAITWALFGEARKNDDSIINDVVQDQTARVDFEFQYEGADYRVVRQKTRGKSTVAEFYIRDPESGSWKSIGEKGVSATNKMICGTLHMDYKTFINASFFLQGKADQFTGQNATERKKILSTILNLEIWEEYKAKAVEKRKNAENEAAFLKETVAAAERELKQEPLFQSRLKEIEQQIKEADVNYKQADQQLQFAKTVQNALQMLQTSLQQKQREEARLSREIQVQQKDLDGLARRLEEIRRKTADADVIEKNYAEFLALRDQNDALNTLLQEYNRLTSRRASLEHVIRLQEQKLTYERDVLLREKSDVEKQQSEKQRLKDGVQKKQAEFKELAAVPAQKAEYEQKLDVIQACGDALKLEKLALENKIPEIEGRIRKMKENSGRVCPTCGREMDEEHTLIHIAELQKEIQAIRQETQKKEAVLEPMRETFRQIKAMIRELDPKVSRGAALKAELQIEEKRLAEINTHLDSWEKQGKEHLRKIEQTIANKSFCQDERNELETVNNALGSFVYDQKEHEQVRGRIGQLAGVEKLRSELILNKSQIEPLEREISSNTARLKKDQESYETIKKEREKAEQEYQAQNASCPDIRTLEAEREAAFQILNKLHSEQGQYNQMLAALNGIRLKLKTDEADLKKAVELADHYKTLEKAFGKDGIPALLIEQAVPEIEEQANELLQQLSNGAMSLRINTQGTYKSKKDEVKETLEILISDAYGVREYEMFSGGEAFRINFSIRLALSKILAQRSGSRLQTLVIDEGFGSQDDEGRARLAEAITAVQNDFEKILVITHLNELKEAFPSRIEVEKTTDGSHVEVIL